MNASRNKFLAALTLAALSAGAWAQSPVQIAPSSQGVAGSSTPGAVTAADVQALKDALAAQQKQIEKLTGQLERQQAWQDSQQVAAKVQTVADQEPAELKNSVMIQQDKSQQDRTSSGLNLQEQPQPATPSNPMESSVSIRFKGITITPGGFAAAEFVR